MKKLSAVLLTLILCSVFVFAQGEYERGYGEPFIPSTVTRINGIPYTVFVNPAQLASNTGFGIQVSGAASLANVSSAMADENSAQNIANILSGTSDKDDLIGVASKLLDSCMRGYTRFSAVDADISMSSNRFALAVDAQAALNVYNSAKNIATAKIVPELNVSIATSFGFSLFNDGETKIDLGLTVRPGYRIYSEPISVTSLLSEEIPPVHAYAGIGIPVDLNVLFTRYDGKVKYNVAVNNINGIYYLKYYDKLEDLVAENGEKSDGGILKTPYKVNFNLIIDPKFTDVNPTLSLELVDINGLLDPDGAQRKWTDIIPHVNCDVAVNAFNVLDILAGYHGGYLYSGVQLGFAGSKVEAYYNWAEFGEEFGSKANDTFTLKVTLGYGY